MKKIISTLLVAGCCLTSLMAQDVVVKGPDEKLQLVVFTSPAEIARMEAELKHKEGFLQGVLKKLSNEKFVNNAPAAVIEMERKKQADAESIINSLKESIAALKKA